MIKAFKRWLAKAAYEGLGEQSEVVPQPGRLGDMMMASGAAFVVFQIDNGFVVRTMNRHNDTFGRRNFGFVYCADHQAIADCLISSAMKDKLGIQSDMFGKEKEAAQCQHQVTQARGPVATQSHI